MNVAEFLLARIAEDESAARVYPELAEALRNQGMSKAADWLAEKGDHGLAECEAKRRIVDLHKLIASAYPGTTIETEPCCAECSADGEYPMGYPCATLSALAAVYADHPDYDTAWRANDA